MELKEAREEIAKLDAEMAELFVKRMDAVREIAAFKKARGLPIEDLNQEKRVIEARSGKIEDETLRSFYIQFLQSTMDVSKRWQRRLVSGMRVAYCGVKGAFAEIAAERIFPEAAAVPFPSFDAAYESVAKGLCDAAVLPIENSYAGEVSQVIDLMFSGELFVNGVYDLSIAQHLLGVPGARLEEVRRVISHPQALSPCRQYIQDHGFESVVETNTAVAAQEVAEKADPATAAIASRETASLYGLQILDHDINESRENTTRFAVFSRTENGETVQKDGRAFILLFTVNDEVGALAKAINVISAYGFNMRVLRSRPMKELSWHYYFYTEVEGDDASDDGRRMLSALRGICPAVRVAGRYASERNDHQGGVSI